MFLQMVELLHHLGLACRLPSDDADNFNLLVPWFLTDYSSAVEALSESMTDHQVSQLDFLFELKVIVH